MQSKYEVESGDEFLARIKPKSQTYHLDQTLFPSGISDQQTIEICGSISTGKSLLVGQLIAKCISPLKIGPITTGGLNLKIIFINTDHQLKMEIIRQMILSLFWKTFENNHEEKKENCMKDPKWKLLEEKLIKTAFKNLIVVNCYNRNEFEISVSQLDEIIYKNNTNLVLIDSIGNYYWEERKHGGTWSIFKYIKQTVGKIQGRTIQSRVPLIYTRISKPNYKEEITCVLHPTLEKINIRIRLEKKNDGKSLCWTSNYEQIEEINCNITNEGFSWEEKAEEAENDKKNKRSRIEKIEDKLMNF